ncbi:MAG: helix-turn-helix transcriptional regulator [Actinomycetota bacterium]|nr:helix-turn-helix transcriptional regulator [Actinomycetota bacterium]
MRGYGQYCPIARGAEIFAERWTPLIVRNLHLGCHTFSEMQAGAPGIPRSLLSQRLALLERYGIVERRPNPKGRGSLYYLTACGQELVDVCEALGRWGARWLEVTPDHLDPYVMLWGMAKLMDADKLPKQRVVIRFDIPDLPKPKQHFWLLVQRPEPEVCIKNPGFTEDIVVTATSEWLAKWHMGWLPLSEAQRQGGIRVDGPAELVRRLPTWAVLSHFANVAPMRAEIASRERRASRGVPAAASPQPHV